LSSLALFGGTPVRRKPFARWPVFDDRERRALGDVLESGMWGGYHPKLREFEETFAAFHGARFGVAVSNGTVSLETALGAAGIQPGDEVIVPPISFIATATAVLRAGGVPVFADIGSDYNLDPARVRQALSPRTRAIIPVHFAGRPADMDALRVIASEHKLAVIEDAAHAHGAAWRGQRVGALGDVASFSFQQSKNLTAGEGGILTGNDPELMERCRSIANQGRRTGGGWYEHVRLGTNQRMTAWQAAVLLVQLSRLEEQLARRAANARWLDRRLGACDFLQPVPPDERVTCHGYYLYMLRLAPERVAGIRKDAFLKALAAEGIPGAAGYPHPLYCNQVFRDYAHRRTECPEAERMCHNSFWVSHEIVLGNEEDLDDFATAMEKVARHAAELA